MKILGTYIILLFLCISCKAQDVLTLPEAINIALKNSLELQLSKNLLESNTVLNNIGVAGGLPLVTGSLTDNEQLSSVNQKLNTGNIISRNASISNSLNSGVIGSILLYNGNRVYATKSRLEQLQKQSEVQLNSQIQNVLAAVMTGYYDVVRQQSYLQTIEKSIDVAKQKLDIVKLSQSVGLANNADLFQAQIDLNALVQDYQSQQLIINQAKAELLRLLSLKSDSVINIQDTIIVDRSLQYADIANSLNKNADIIAADYQIKINEFIVKETNALRYPAVSANAGFNFNRNQSAAGQLLLSRNYGPVVGLTLDVPIFNGSVYKRQKQVAEIGVRNAKASKEILVRDYNAQVVKTFESYVSTLQQVDTEKQTYSISFQLLQLTLLRFRLKQATIVEVKNAQQSYQESSYRLVNLNYVAKASEIELKRLSNKLSL